MDRQEYRPNYKHSPVLCDGCKKDRTHHDTYCTECKKFIDDGPCRVHVPVIVGLPKYCRELE